MQDTSALQSKSFNSILGSKRNKIIAACLGLGIGIPIFAVLIVFITGIKIFVIQPIGAIPDGVTIITYDKLNLAFIDSPDAFCKREMGDISWMCRGGAISGVVADKKTILLRLPYSSFLYSLTGAPETYR